MGLGAGMAIVQGDNLEELPWQIRFLLAVPLNCQFEHQIVVQAILFNVYVLHETGSRACGICGTNHASPKGCLILSLVERF